MVVVSYSGREINAKIVYYGPGLSGKTTNLEKIYDSVPETNRGRMVSMKTQTDRTLFFDLLPLDLGDLQGMKTRLLLYTVPGQVYYNATRKLVLKGVDAVVFVADSAPDKMAENRESLANLEMNLKAYGIDIRNIPWVLQLNKRDLPNAMPVADMTKELNRYNVPVFEAQAANGAGVFETLRGVSKLLLARITKDVLEKERGSLARVQKEKAAAEPAAAASAPVAAAPAAAPPSEPPAPGGKILKYLKRGQEEPARTEAPPSPAPPAVPETPAAPAPSAAFVYDRNPFAEPATPSAAAPQNPPLLPDDALLEEEPIRSDMAQADAEDRRPQNAEEELTLDEPEFVRTGAVDTGSVRIPPPEPETIPPATTSLARATSRAAVAEATVTGSGDVRRVTVPVDLGQLPRTGRVTLTFEVRIQVDSGEGSSSSAPSQPAAAVDSGIDESFTQDLEVLR